MKAAPLLLLLIALPAQARECVLNFSGPEISLQRFRGSTASEEACRGHRDYQAFRDFVKSARVVFLTGYKNETHKDYAGQFGEAIRELSGGAGSFARVDTDSRAAVEPDTLHSICPAVRARLGGSASSIIFGHSKGGASALYLTRACPDVARAAKAIVSINGVIGGSGVADASVEALNGGHELAYVLDKLKSIVNATYVLKPYIGDQVAGVSLTSRSSALRLEALRNRHVSTANVFCVTSEASSLELQSIDPSPAGQKAAEFLRDRMKRVFGGARNDGLMALDKQWDPRLCPARLHVPGANHMALVEADSSPVSADAETKKAFAAYLLYLVFRSAR